MRFSCESCGAQYMISDEKVGPAGVRVRCKKCSEVIRVRRDASLDPQPAAAGAATSPSDAETTNDWYVAIDDRQVGPLPSAALRARWESGEIGPDTLAWRTGMSDWSPLSAIPDLAGRLAASPTARRWAEESAPNGASAAPHQAAAGSGSMSGVTSGGQEPVVSGATANGVSHDVANGVSHGVANGASNGVAHRLNGSLNGKAMTWQPSAGSALATLASQEMEALEAQEKQTAMPDPAAPPAPEPPRSGAALLDQIAIPEGGVDPTHLIPLPMKGIERTTEMVLKPKVVAPEPEPEPEPTQIRQLRKSAKRSGVAWGVAVASLAAVAVAAGFWILQANHRGDTAPVAQAPRSLTPAPAAPANPEPAPAPAPAPAAVASAPAPAPSTPPAEAVSPPAETKSAPAPVVASAPEEKAPPPRKHATKSEAAASRSKSGRLAATERPVKQQVAPPLARPSPSVAPPPAAVAEAPKKKTSGDPLLDVEGDGELEKELSSTKPRRNVYVPPAIGSDLPENVSVSQINEAVVGQKAALLRCIEEQRAVDPNARGTLKMRWVIGGDGATRDVRSASDEFSKQPIAPCISNVVKGIRFPRSRTTGQEVVFPFKF